jgi:hypothetical protein
LRTQISKGTTGYTKVNSKYQPLKKDTAKAEAASKKEISTLKAEANDKEKKKKQDETAIAAEASSRATHAFKLQLKMEGEDHKAEKKKKEAEAKEQKRRASIEIARSASSKGFTIPQNQQERAAIFPPQQQQQPSYGAPPQSYHPQPAQQYLQAYAPPPMQYQPFPMQQYPPAGYASYQPGMQQYHPGLSQIYPPPPTMARASSGASITPTPQEQGTTYMTDQEMEQTIVDNSSLGFPDEDTQEEEVRGAEAAALRLLKTVTLRWKIRMIRQ